MHDDEERELAQNSLESDFLYLELRLKDPGSHDTTPQDVLLGGVVVGLTNLFYPLEETKRCGWSIVVAQLGCSRAILFGTVDELVLVASFEACLHASVSPTFYHVVVEYLKMES